MFWWSCDEERARNLSKEMECSSGLLTKRSPVAKPKQGSMGTKKSRIQPPHLLKFL